MSDAEATKALDAFLRQQADIDLPTSVGAADDGMVDAGRYEDELGGEW